MVEYALLAESDRLEQARQMDARYHQAKLVAYGFNQPELVWQEHEEFRLELLVPPLRAMLETTPEHWSAMGDVYRRLVVKGIVSPPQQGMH